MGIEEKQSLQEKEASDEMMKKKESMESSSSLEMEGEDDSSSSSSFRPLYQLSELMNHLPIIKRRRGLSKFYSGKSQSFACLANVEQDLQKKEGCYNRRMKWCKSYGGNLNLNQNHLSPKRMITKRASPTPTPRRSASFSPSLDHAIDGFPPLLLFHA